MVTPVISLDKSSNGYLGITDITTYTAGQRNLTGIQVFWSSDAFAADVNFDQSNSDNWQVPAAAQQTYTVQGFYSYTWDVLNNVSVGPFGIVLYNGYFYIKKTAGTLNPSTAPLDPMLDGTNWTPFVLGKACNLSAIGGSNYTALTEADMYAVCVLSTQQVGTTTATVASVTLIDQDAFVLTKQDCESWQVEININCTLINAELIDYDGTVLVSNIAPSGTIIPIDLSSFGDGSYTVKITYDDPISQVTTWVMIPILEVCNANACYDLLFKYVLCKCDDPCDPCENLYTKWHDLLLIRELVTSINQMVDLQHSQFVGLYPITQSEGDLLTDIGQMIDKLKLVTDRCGLCTDAENLTLNCS